MSPESLDAFVNALENIPERQPLEAGAVPRLPHVTDVFVFTGDSDSPRMVAAAQRGTIVHTLTERHDLGHTFDVEPVYHGYLKAWTRLRSETGMKIHEIELTVGNETLGYIGRLDRIAEVGRHLAVIDIKSGMPWPTHGLQLAAYERGYRHLKGLDPKKPIKRFGAYLKADGTYTLKEYTDPGDLQVFLAMLKVAQWEWAAGLRALPKRRD